MAARQFHWHEIRKRKRRGSKTRPHSPPAGGKLPRQGEFIQISSKEGRRLSLAKLAELVEAA